MEKLGGGQRRGTPRKRTPKSRDAADYPWLTENPAFSGNLRDGADKFISESRVYEEVMENQLQPDRELNRVADRVRIATQKQHIEAVAFAYAFWIKASINPAYQGFLLDAAKSWKRVTRSTTALHLIVARFLSYGEDDDGPTGKKKGLYNRDVRAILALQAQGVPPDRVVELADKPGEGLKYWDQKQRKSRAKKPNNCGDRLQAEHARKRALYTPVVAQNAIAYVCLSLQFGDEVQEHRFFSILNTPESRQIVEKFKADVVELSSKELEARVITHRVVTGLGSIPQEKMEQNRKTLP